MRQAIFGWLLLGGFTAQIFAGTSTKTFDFGAGGDNPTFRSHARTFAPPAGVAIVVAVNYRTSGEALIPIVIEIEDAARKNLASREVAAEKGVKRVVFNVAASDNAVHGCERGWQVRVRTKSGEIPSARVYGDISFSFVDPSPLALGTEGGAPFRLVKKNQTTKQIDAADAFRHPGILSVRAGWLDALGVGALPLKFEILRPDGTIAKSLTGYAANSNSSPKLDFTYNLTAADARQAGAWRLRIVNDTEQDVIEINPKISFTRKCFE
jgi:hypothetical protein